MGIATLIPRVTRGRLAPRTFVGACLAVLAGCLGVPAYASAKPVITGLEATPSIVAPGGTVTVSATVSEATECTISANKAVAGLPVAFSCESASVSREVVMPQNSKQKAAKYKLTLSAKGTAGKTKAHATVYVNPFAPPPVYTLADQHFARCGETGIVISGDGTSAVWGNCTLAFNGEEWINVGDLPEKGEPLAVSSDGLTLVMKYAAGIQVFARSSEEEEWAPQAMLAGPSEYPPYEDTTQVGISANGNTVLIDGLKGLRAYQRTMESWAQVEAPPLGGGQFCDEVALSADGKTALVDCGDKDTECYVLPFVRTGASWTQQGPALVGSGEESAEFGQVTLSADGDTAIIGAPQVHKKAGEAWIFHRSGETWSQQGPPITPPEKHTESLLGEGLALSADGNRALIAATAYYGLPEHGAPESRKPGAAYVFERSGESWSFVERLQPSTEPGGEFGRWIALSESGEMALIANYGALHLYSG